MNFFQETFSRDFNKTLVRTGAFLAVVYGIGVIAAQLRKA